MYDSEFAKKIMSWLKSNEPTMIDNEEETQTIYIRIPFNGLEYVYSMPSYKIGKGVYEEFDFNAIYSTKEKICLFKNFGGKQMTTIQEEGMGFYERFSVVKNFNKIFEEIFPPIFVTKYKNKALNKIKIETHETCWRNAYYIDKARTIYLQGKKEVSILNEFRKEVKRKTSISYMQESINEMPKEEYFRALIDFAKSGQDESVVKDFIENTLYTWEEGTQIKLYDNFFINLGNVIAITDIINSYIPTEDEKCTKNMVQAYNAFFRGKEPPKKVKITVVGRNEGRSYKYQKAGINIEGKIMTMKIDPHQLSSPWQALDPTACSISNLSGDLQLKQDYNGKIELPFTRIHAKDILKIEYGRKTIWEKEN